MSTLSVNTFGYPPSVSTFPYAPSDRTFQSVCSQCYGCTCGFDSDTGADGEGVAECEGSEGHSSRATGVCEDEAITTASTNVSGEDDGQRQHQRIRQPQHRHQRSLSRLALLSSGHGTRAATLPVPRTNGGFMDGTTTRGAEMDKSVLEFGRPDQSTGAC